MSYGAFACVLEVVQKGFSEVDILNNSDCLRNLLFVYIKAINLCSLQSLACNGVMKISQI